MGVLEDAIREHLELKRRHGASDEEVERKELEALGPARREFEAPAEETAGDADGTPDAVPEPAVPEPAEPEPAAAALPEHAVEPEPEPEPEPGALTDEPQPLAHEPPLEPLPEPEAATRVHESPIPDPALTDPRAPDFVEDEEAEQPREPQQRDFDFD